jgi:purine-binding chemotaxis protein CheW
MSSVHVRFRLGEERYALPVADVQEVADVGQLAGVPGAPEAILGVRNLRAQVLPVIDLATVLGKDRGPEQPRLLIVQRGNRRAGLIIDEVTDVGELAGDPQETAAAFMAQELAAEGGIVGVLDLDAVFVSLEQRAAA